MLNQLNVKVQTQSSKYMYVLIALHTTYLLFAAIFVAHPYAIGTVLSGHVSTAWLVMSSKDLACQYYL